MRNEIRVNVTKIVGVNLRKGKNTVLGASDTSKKLSRSQQRRRDEIIAASLKIFDRDGFESARMADIAKEADVAKGTLYLYFDSKAALLEGVIESVIMPTLTVVKQTATDHSGSARELLENQIRITARRMASPEMRTILRHMISGGSKHERIVKFYFENVINNGRQLFGSTLKYGVERGEFKATAAEIDPLVIFGANVYAAVWKILFDDLSPIDIDKLVDDQLTFVIPGLLRESSKN